MVASMTLAALVPMSPGHADGQVGLSRDGHTWFANLTQPLFDPAIRWVPGDSRTGFFYVRNQTKDAGSLDVRVDSGRVASLMQAGGLKISARAGSGQWKSFSGTGTRLLVHGRRLPAGATTRVSVKVNVPADAGNLTQTKQFDLRFTARLSERTGPTAGPGTGGGLLPSTGGPATPLLLALTGLLLGCGALLVGSARKKGRQ